MQVHAAVRRLPPPPIWDTYRHYTMQVTYRDHRKHVIHKVGFIHNSVMYGFCKGT